MTTYRRVLAIGEFRALLAAEGVTTAARTMQMLALSVLVYARTGSTLLAAVAYLAGFLPQAIGASTLLSLADRARPRLLLPVWDCAWAALAVLLALGGLPIWAMIVLVMLAGVVDAPVGACRNAVVVDAVPEEAYVLARSVLNLSVGFMQIVGFAVAGSLLTLIGPRTALLVGAGLALVSAVVQRTGLRDRAPRATGPASVATTMRGQPGTPPGQGDPHAGTRDVGAERPHRRGRGAVRAVRRGRGRAAVRGRGARHARR